MKYRTIEFSTHMRLHRERRSTNQPNKFPLEDLDGNIILKDRRVISDLSAEGMEVTEAKISKAEFQKYFEKNSKTN